VAAQGPEEIALTTTTLPSNRSGRAERTVLLSRDKKNRFDSKLREAKRFFPQKNSTNVNPRRPFIPKKKASYLVFLSEGKPHNE